MTTRHRTFTEQARRAQLIDVTVGLVADNGYAGTSLSRIAEGAGITKAAILYHFSAKETLVDAAYEQVMAALVTDVGSAVDASAVADAPIAYVQAMIAHLRDHPRHTRMIIEALGRPGRTPVTEQRWGPLAALVDAAARARGTKGLDARGCAIIVGGAIDGIVTEALADPAFDTRNAGDQLAAMLETALSA